MSIVPLYILSNGLVGTGGGGGDIINIENALLKAKFSDPLQAALSDDSIKGNISAPLIAELGGSLSAPLTGGVLKAKLLPTLEAKVE
jgi:hypothetical protein